MKPRQPGPWQPRWTLCRSLARGSKRTALTLTPPAVAAFLTASALAPVAAALVLPPAAAVAAVVAQLGGMGTNYLADVVAEAGRRVRVPDGGRRRAGPRPPPTVRAGRAAAA
ncbi:hypothetical protein FHX34_1011750 [Actinoplanes teichomyceticus]|uniref:Uncharacterized protein n=1 Tax=Actinoplanes teichomyceticus TaxID=1867 RepID=A0A561WSB9_ACTTI|nr:hypothetical protein FHX34_1011750 [Actinoplanes teichomyceticus]GIF15150.1 hypothetical protein Ate01nite_51820 [Actinoplanes teichomyceticus]